MTYLTWSRMGKCLNSRMPVIATPIQLVLQLLNEAEDNVCDSSNFKKDYHRNEFSGKLFERVVY